MPSRFDGLKLLIEIDIQILWCVVFDKAPTFRDTAIDLYRLEQGGGGGMKDHVHQP